jgi:hypothetical protein
VVFFGRFVSILRTCAAFLAGTSRMRWRKFLPANAAGGILWAGIYTFAAYLAGNALQRASHTIDLIIVGVAVLAVTGVIFVVRRQTGKLGLQAEAAYPGPLEWPSGRPNCCQSLSTKIDRGLDRAARSLVRTAAADARGQTALRIPRALAGTKYLTAARPLDRVGVGHPDISWGNFAGGCPHHLSVRGWCSVDKA